VKRSGELQRRTPLERKTGLRAKTPWRWKPKQRERAAQVAKSTGPAASTVRAVRTRDDHQCALAGVLGTSCDPVLTTQHRCPRGSGGSTVEWINDPENLLTLCGNPALGTGHHSWAEKNRTAAYALGVLVKRARTSEETRQRVFDTPVMVRGEWKRAEGRKWKIALPPAAFRNRWFADVMAELLA